MTSQAIARLRRLMLEKWIEDVIALLDTMDGDADLEDDDREQDNSDCEPWLGWTVHGVTGQTFDPDKELDAAEMGIADIDAAAEQFPGSAYGRVE